MTIANRFLLGFAIATLLMLGVGLFAMGQMEVAREATRAIVNNDVATMRQLTQVRTGESDMRAFAERAFAEAAGRRGAGAAAQAAANWRAADIGVRRGLEQAIAMAADNRQEALTPERAEAWRQIGVSLTEALRHLQAVEARRTAQFAAIAAGDLAAAQVARDGVSIPREQFEAALNRADELLDAIVNTSQERLQRVYRISQISTLVGLALAIAVAVGVALLTQRSIAGPLAGFTTFVDRVGRGDLTAEASASGKDEFGQLGGTLNAMVAGLRDLARQSREATENLNAAAAEIRASTQQQAASVEEQLAAVQETAATVDEITHSGAQIGRRAQEVIASAQATVQTSNEGLRAVDETARAMDAIREQAETVAENIVGLSERTQAIGDIIATVNDISERSHLLALNAAIEAAAAGESGRSFAVVASEMKLLADQAKEATGQVRGILGDIQRGINASVMLTEEAVKRVSAGKERTDTAHRTITDMSARVQESVQTFQQIVASTNQQQLGIEQVMGALQNIRDASQQTATGTRQLDEAAANLSDLSRQLLALAERYRL